MTRATTALAALLLLPAVLSVTAGCDDKKTNLAPAASSLAPTPPPPPGSMTMKFAIDQASKTSMELDAPKEKIKATSTGGTGNLDVDLMNIQNSRGEIKMDLTTLTTTGRDTAKDNAAQTTHARTWLEVADGEDGKLDEAVKTANRYAVYAIRGIDNPSAQDVTKVAPSQEDGDDVRTVSLRSKGELLIHGHKVDREAELEVKFHYPPGGDAGKPMWIGIKTKTPLRVVLAEHDVKPRDGFGKIAKGSFNLLGTKVADNADISLDLRAKPQP
jgi:hypothetical protein